VVKGARNGCTIDNVSLVNSNELAAIKRQEYKIDDIDIPEYPPSETPRIAASFGEMSNTYQALRMQGPAATYYQPEKANDAVSKTLADMQQEIERLKGGTGGGSGAHVPQARAPNPHEELQSLEKRVAELRAQGGGGGGGAPAAAAGGQTGQRQAVSQWNNTAEKQPSTGNQQVDTLLNDLTPGSAGGKPPTSNQHIIHMNPQDDIEARFMQVAGVFDRPIATRQEKEQASRALSEAAQQSRADRDEVAQLRLQNQMLAKKYNESEARAASHEAEKAKQAKQAATVLKRLLQKNLPPPTDAEAQELESGANDMSQGKMDEGMQKLLPAMIRASAFCDVRDSAQSMEDEDQSSGQYTRALRQALGQSSEGLIQASGANRSNKRSYDTSNTSAHGSSSSSNNRNATPQSKNWQRLSLRDDIPDDMARRIAEVEHDPDIDTENFKLPERVKNARTR
jgi:hypothetical protein